MTAVTLLPLLLTMTMKTTTKNDGANATHIVRHGKLFFADTDPASRDDFFALTTTLLTNVSLLP